MDAEEERDRIIKHLEAALANEVADSVTGYPKGCALAKAHGYVSVLLEGEAGPGNLGGLIRRHPLRSGRGVEPQTPTLTITQQCAVGQSTDL